MKNKGTSVKVTFGKRKKGSAKKRLGPKDKKVSEYNRQGR
jgi:hypothetical protein